MKNKVFEYNVNKECLLLDFLYENVKNSKNNIKSFLKNGNVYVNDKIQTKHDYKVFFGDKVVLKLFHTTLDVLYEDNDLLIVNKPSGCLTIGTEKEKEKTLYREVSNYVKQDNKNMKIFIVNRLDKDTSGIVVFAKSERVKQMLQSKWNDIVTLRKYVAVVDGKTDESGVIKSYLSENREHVVYSGSNGKLAVTKYERIKCNEKYSMLYVYLLTGRKNQIRVHMKDIGHSVLGDLKYGSTKSPINRLMLHCMEIEFINPLNNKNIKIICNYPIEFDSLF